LWEAKRERDRNARVEWKGSNIQKDRQNSKNGMNNGEIHIKGV